MANVKGSALIPRLKYIEEKSNTTVKDQIINQMNHAFRDDCKAGLLMGHWYPFHCYTDLNNAIDKVMGKGDLKLIPLLGRYSAD